MGDSNDELEWFSGCEHRSDGNDNDNKIITHTKGLLEYIAL